MEPAAWFDEATERTILLLFTIRGVLAEGDMEPALKGLLSVQHGINKIAQNVVAAMPAGLVVNLVKERLEVQDQQPYKVFEAGDGFIGFMPDHTPVPDRYVEPT
jgi:hypothetical protein